MAAIGTTLNRLGAISLGLGLGIATFQSVLYTVDGGERALIFDRIQGVKENPVGEGTHLFVPWLQKPIIYDVRTTPRNIKSETGTKDLQQVLITLRVLYRPDIPKLKQIYTSLGLRYDEKVLPSIGNEVLKATVAEFDAADLIIQREVVSAKVEDEMTRRAAQFGIILEDVSITHLSFSREYMAAIEQKQVAQQVAERQRFLVDKAKHEKLAEVILAEGETESARLIQEAMKDGNEFLQLRRIEAAKEIAALLGRSGNVVYLPDQANMLMNMNA